MPDARDLHISRALTNLSMRYKNEEYIGDQICKRVPVKKQADKIKVYNKNHLRIEQTFIGTGKTPTPVFDWGFAADLNYYAEGYGVKELVTQNEVDNADSPIDAKADTTEALTDLILLDREYRVQAIYRDTAVITDYATLTGTARWNDYESGVSDPITNIKTRVAAVRANSGHTPNSIVMDYLIALNLVAHPDVIEMVKGHAPVKFTTMLQILSDLFGLKVYIGRAMYNSATEGATDVLAAVWGKDVLIAYINPRISKKVDTLGATFDWGGRKTTEWANPDPEGTYVRVKERGLHAKVLNATCGTLIKTVID